MNDPGAVIKRIITDRLGLDQGVVTSGRRIVDLGADSLDRIDIVMEVEDELGVDLLDADIEGMETVGDLIAAVEKRRKDA